MTAKNGKPKGDAEPARAEPVPPADPAAPTAGDESAEAAMQTNNQNGVAGVRSKAVIGQDIQAHLGQKLKASYNELVRQPVPDKFRQLLEELERRERKK